jgi:hypothetical protein
MSIGEMRIGLLRRLEGLCILVIDQRGDNRILGRKSCLGLRLMRNLRRNYPSWIVYALVGESTMMKLDERGDSRYTLNREMCIIVPLTREKALSFFHQRTRVNLSTLLACPICTLE